VASYLAAMNFLRKMKFFTRKRNKARDASHENEKYAGWSKLAEGNRSPAYGDSSIKYGPPATVPTVASARALARLPPRVLDRIFSFVCPHTLDESYDTCELSAVEDACPLCDLRDLAHCVATCKPWWRQAVKRLYG
jgi:hypothetical protein